MSFKTNHQTVTFLFVLFFGTINLFAQFTEIINDNENLKSDGKYYTKDNVIYTDRIVVKFNAQVVSVSEGKVKTDRNNVSEKYAVKNVLAENADDYGEMDLIKAFPDAKWGDVVRTNNKTGKVFTSIERSQIFTIKYPNPVPLKSILKEFNALPEVEYAEPPVIISTFEDPNDPYYDNGSNPYWYFEKIEASAGWDITHGSSSIIIGIVDTGVKQDHDDLDTKIIGGDGLSGGHGTEVASVAAAKTNNNNDVAGIGWNTSLYTYEYGGMFGVSTTAHKIYVAARYCDIINCSWGTYKQLSEEELYEIGCPDPELYEDEGIFASCSYQCIEDEIEDAINSGVIIVAAAGNYSINGVDPSWDPNYPPYSSYPAAYNDVIAVSGSKMNGSTEVFKSGYNYGNFIDFCSPSDNIWIVKVNESTPIQEGGTSLGAPIVSGLVSLILAQDPNEDVFEILKEGTDNIDQSLYPDDGNGWNNHTGYGRINMRKALEAVFPDAPTNLYITGSVGQHPTLHWNANSESDLDGYKIYQKVGSGSTSLLTTVGSTTTSYTDNGVTIGNRFDPLVTYWVSAFDLASNESGKSNSSWVHAGGISKNGDPILDEDKQSMPDRFTLYPAYPNPFNPETIVKYYLPEQAIVQIKIYNQLGVLVFEENKTMGEGMHQFRWQPLSKSAGVYYLKILVGGQNYSQKLMLLK